jgi:hypothetical protein
MNIVRQGVHAVREFLRIRHKAAVFIPVPQRPAVIDYKIMIACVTVAPGNHDIRHFTDQRIGDVAAKGVPGVPAERGTLSEH